MVHGDVRKKMFSVFKTDPLQGSMMYAFGKGNFHNSTVENLKTNLGSHQNAPSPSKRAPHQAAPAAPPTAPSPPVAAPGAFAPPERSVEQPKPKAGF